MSSVLKMVLLKRGHEDMNYNLKEYQMSVFCSQAFLIFQNGLVNGDGVPAPGDTWDIGLIVSTWYFTVIPVVF